MIKSKQEFEVKGIANIRNVIESFVEDLIWKVKVY